MQLPQITELDFLAIRENLKQYFKQSTVFRDYNFDGPALATLLDVLAHDTYYKSFYLNQVFNEAFLDSTLLRGTAVSRAKELDYTPRSAKSAQAVITVNFVPFDFSTSFILVPKYFRFQGTINNQIYTFSTGQDLVVNKDATGKYTATFSIFEGDVVIETTNVPIYTTSTYTIPIQNRNIDTDSLSVFVGDTLNSVTVNQFTRATDVLAVTATSPIFFLQENMQELYELQFGDNILGKALLAGNKVISKYRVSNGTGPNGCRFFTQLDVLPAIVSMSVSTVTIAFGGGDKETIDSIKYNAPRNYDKQNRNVTENDYLQSIKSVFPNIQSISVWGGDKNEIPIFGKVFISVKPTNGFTISDTQKNQIATLIQPENILTTQSEFIDPVFNYVIPNITVKYNALGTTLTPQQVLQNIATTIKTFEQTQLSDFKKPFFFSKFSSAIDNIDTSILSNSSTVLLQRRFAPQFNSTFTYALNFHKSIFHPYDGFTGAVSSSGFRLPLYSQFLFIDDDGFGNLRVYFLNGVQRVYVPFDGTSTSIGTVDYRKGLFKFRLPVVALLNNTTEMQINILPSDKDITPVLNEILLITQAQISLFDNNSQSLVASGNVNTAGDTTSLFQNAFLTNVLV